MAAVFSNLQSLPSIMFLLRFWLIIHILVRKMCLKAAFMGERIDEVTTGFIGIITPDLLIEYPLDFRPKSLLP